MYIILYVCTQHAFILNNQSTSNIIRRLRRYNI